MDIQKTIDKAYSKYKDSVNMTFTELRIWKDNPLSKKASLDRKPIFRNLRLLSKPKKKWTLKDAEDANKAISYIARAKKIPRAKTAKKGELSKNEIALRNWGFDTYK